MAMEKDGKPTGFGVEIVKAIADEAGIPLKDQVVGRSGGTDAGGSLESRSARQRDEVAFGDPADHPRG